MTLPDENQWARIEKFAAEIELLPPEAASVRLNELYREGEPSLVLSYIGRWLDLPPPPVPFAAGDRLEERFVLIRKLGEGGMGVVWEARDQSLERNVAIKMIHPTLATPALRERFRHEMRMLGRLSHPDIVQIYDVGEASGLDGNPVPYFVMELVEDGVPLGEWATSRREQRLEVLQVMGAVCLAVQHAHERAIVHRDLKPSNILVRNSGRVAILDFGIARMMDCDSAGQPEVFSGTPQYAAPEQHLGRDGNIQSGQSVDVYAVGTILFEVLSGQRLFDFRQGMSLAQMRNEILNGTRRRLREILPDCATELDELVASTTRRDPLDRAYSMASMARALMRMADSLRSCVPAPVAWKPDIGKRVPGLGWTLQEKLGEGGTGEVWMGFHEELSLKRVFKFCDSEEKARTLRREMTLFRLLRERIGQNPHFIQLHEVSLTEPPWFLMMEHVPAQDLAQWCDAQSGRISGITLETTIEIIAQVAEALQVAHEAGILHRDIKPANILVQAGSSSDSTGSLHVYVADFGIGQIVTDELLQGGTMLGFTRTVQGARQTALSGSVRYLAPEILEGRAATARSDIFSLGVVLWQLLTANLDGALDAANWRIRVSDPLLRQDLDRCLAGDPSERWASAAEFASSLRALPIRRTAELRARQEQLELEKRAYRRGLIRATLIAATIIAALITFAVVAWTERAEAKRAKAKRAFEQAANIARLDRTAGRRERGLSLLEEAAEFPDDPVLLRSTAAALFALPDFGPLLESRRASRVEDHNRGNGTAPPAEARSDDGTLIVSGSNRDRMRGVIEFAHARTGPVRALERTDFPWVPIPEPGFLKLSPDGKWLAAAGPESSLHVLICNASTAELDSYLFAGDALTSLAWHPQGRIVATGHADGTVRLWDRRRASASNTDGKSTGGFALPPKLTVPAQDTPLAVLEGWRDGIAGIVFHRDGQRVVAADRTGWIRVWSILVDQDGLLPSRDQLADTRPAFVVETKVEGNLSRDALDFEEDTLVARADSGLCTSLTVQAAGLAREQWMGEIVRKIAWTDDGSSLCLLTTTGARCYSGSDLRLLAALDGKSPQGLAFDPHMKSWVIPQDGRYVDRVVGNLQTRGTSLAEWWKLPRSLDEQGARLGVAASKDGDVALYYGRSLQFARRGQPHGAPIPIVQGSGVFDDLLWDDQGRLLSVTFATPQGRSVETYATSAGSAKLLGGFKTSATQLRSARDGTYVLERSIEEGIAFVDAVHGTKRIVNSTAAARQDAPLALSPDRKWIAAAADRNTIWLLNAQSGSMFASLVAPRRGSILALDWNPSGDALVAATSDGIVYLWKLESWHAWLKDKGLAE